MELLCFLKQTSESSHMTCIQFNQSVPPRYRLIHATHMTTLDSRAKEKTDPQKSYMLNDAAQIEQTDQMEPIK